MAATQATLICPKGHTSTEADYCSECGARMQGAGSRAGASLPLRVDQALATGTLCPDCGTLREQQDIVFCEVCGYNFATGAHGEVGVVPAPVEQAPQPESAPEAEPVVAQPVRWSVTITVDPSLRTVDSPEPPIDTAPFTLELDQPVTLIGRRDEARGIFPEIALPFDEAVSRRHALLQKDDGGHLLLRDIGAANGTRLNGKEVEPMTDLALHDGDEVTLGHWSRILVRTVA